MSASRDILVELAIEPLAGQEEERGAAQEIRERIVESGVSEAEIAEAVVLLERADRRGIVRHWKTGLYVLVGVLVVVGVVQNLRMSAALRMISGMGSMGSDEPAPKVLHPARFSADELLLLYGREGAESKAEKWKPLWESEPKNPAYFAQYVAAVLQDTDTIPDELLQKASEIDPDNGWYAALKAGSLLKNNVKRGELTGEEKEALKAAEYTVLDEGKFAEALALVHEAARKPRYDSYQEEMMRKRLTVMGRPTDWFSFIAQVAYLAGDFSPGLMGTRSMSQALAVDAGRCAEKGDREGSLRAFAAWEVMTGHLIADGYTLVDLLVAKVVLTEPAAHFRDAARKVGLEDEAKRFEKLARWKYEDWKNKNTRRKNRVVTEEEILIERKLSMMASLSLPMLAHQVKKPPVIRVDDVRPSRLMEYAFFLRMFAGAGCITLLFVMGAAALRLACSSKQNQRLSRRFCEMLPAREWMFILCMGVLPVLWYGFLWYLTPLSPREWSVRMSGITPFPLQFLFVVLLIPVLTSAWVSWRCDRRLALLCGKSKSPKWRWWMAVSAFLVIPMYGAFLPLAFVVGVGSRVLNILLWVSVVLAAVPFLWAVFRIIKTAFGKKDPTPRSACLIRMALPGLCVGILALSVAAFLLRWEERHWLAKDRLMVVTPEEPGMTRYEWQVTQIMRAELRELLGKL